MRNTESVTLVTHAFSSRISGVFYTDFIEILAPTCNKLVMITGDFHPAHISRNVQIENVHSVKENQPGLTKIIDYMWAYFEICVRLVKARSHIVIISEGSSALTLPLLLARLLRSKVVLLVAVSNPRAAIYSYRGFLVRSVVSTISQLLSEISYAISQKIIVSAAHLVSYFGLEKYENKLVCGNYTVFLSDTFRIKKDFDARENIVGWVGRLMRAKGCLEFARAVPMILSKKETANFLVVGEGPQEGEMRRELENKGCLHKVNFVGAVPHDDVADYFNEMKFHVLPSHTEALSVTVAEAMACGTVVIANSVGGMSDVVIDGETGFLLENNSPDTIANKVIEVWERPDLERIRTNALEFVKKNLHHDRVVENWSNLLNNL